MRHEQLQYYIGSNAERRRLLILKMGQGDNLVVANPPFSFR